MIRLYIDADACPVKDEVYRVAKRFGLIVTLVANQRMRYPDEDWIELIVVETKGDAADDWIVEDMMTDDIVITNDIPLASRVIKKGGHVVKPNGMPLNANNIGEAMASRELMERLRETGSITGGPAPFDKSDRSRFLMRLDETIKQVQRANAS